MSLTDDPAAWTAEPPDQWGDGPAPYAPGEAPSGGRTPPQDLAAEQSVLGAMMISKDAIADVVEVLRGADYYRPAHEEIHDAILDLYGRGEPADMVTVAGELQRRGQLQKVGGAPYLHTLAANVPIAANAGFYAEIVYEKAILRRLVNAGTKIVQIGYAGEGEVEGIVNEAQAEIYRVTDRNKSEDYAPLSDIMDGVLDEIEAIENREAGIYGVPTGFADLDELTNGLHAGQMIVVAARPAMGKALALDTPLPTPTGWTTMGEVKVGDELYDADGHPTRVVAATGVMVDRPCFEIEFSDGSTIVADAEHQWLTGSTEPGGRGAAVVTTEEIARTLRIGDGRRGRPSVVNARPLAGRSGELVVPAYVLGAWLGGGHADDARLTCANEIAMYVEGLGVHCESRGGGAYELRLPGADDDRTEVERAGTCAGPPSPGVGSFTARLRELGVVGRKSIPPSYLRAAEGDRRALLAGLLDTAGTVCERSGSVRLTVATRRLARDASELIVSLGYRCDAVTERRDRSQTSPVYDLTFCAADDVFRLESKAVRHKENRPPTTRRVGRRRIVAVRPVRSVPVRCVQVDNADHLYLAGRSMIPTHNSTLALDFCRAASVGHNLTSAFFSLEMTRAEIVMRLLSAEARIPLNHIRNGKMGPEEWDRLARHVAKVSAAPMFVDDSPNMTMTEIRAKARRLKQKHDLKLMVIDYLQLMSSGKKVESRQLEVSEFSRQMKLLAKELEIPIIALSQLNRGPEQRADKRPAMSDLRESGCLTADTRLLRADTNAEITLGELISGEVRDIPVWALDDRLKLVPRTLTHAFPSGVKPVFEVTLASGRRVRATANHPFLTYDGWMPLAELEVGSRVGSIRHVPPPLEITPREEDEIVRVARRLAGAAGAPGEPFHDAGRAGTSVPEWVFSLPKDQVGLFLRQIWTAGGGVAWDEASGTGQLSYRAASRRLADDLARLLARYNIFSRIETVAGPDGRDGHVLQVHGVENQLRFVDEIAGSGELGERAARLGRLIREIAPDADADRVPVAVWDDVRTILGADDTTHRGPTASRERLAAVAEVLEHADVEVVATNDVHWDSIVAIEPLGEREVYDATVLGVHNFVAEGIALHNSIEQDADMVILLHRDDAYERESTRPGEADLIVAKHRNGATRDIVVAFQGHYSRFVDMAHG